MKRALQDPFLEQLCRRMQDAGMLPDLDAFDRIVCALQLLNRRYRVVPVKTKLDDFHAICFFQLQNKLFDIAVPYRKI